MGYKLPCLTQGLTFTMDASPQSTTPHKVHPPPAGPKRFVPGSLSFFIFLFHLPCALALPRPSYWCKVAKLIEALAPTGKRPIGEGLGSVCVCALRLNAWCPVGRSICGSTFLFSNVRLVLFFPPEALLMMPGSVGLLASRTNDKATPTAECR